MLVLMFGKNIGMLNLRALSMFSYVSHARARVIFEIFIVLTSSIQKRRGHEIGSAKWNMQMLWFTNVAHANKQLLML